MDTIIALALVAISRMAENIPTETINELYDDDNNIIGYQHGCSNTWAENQLIISTCAVYDEMTRRRRGVCRIISVDGVSFEPHILTISAEESESDIETLPVTSVTGELGNYNDLDTIKQCLIEHIKFAFSIKGD